MLRQHIKKSSFLNLWFLPFLYLLWIKYILRAQDPISSAGLRKLLPGSSMHVQTILLPSLSLKAMFKLTHSSKISKFLYATKYPQAPSA